MAPLSSAVRRVVSGSSAHMRQYPLTELIRDRRPQEPPRREMSAAGRGPQTPGCDPTFWGDTAERSELSGGGLSVVSRATAGPMARKRSSCRKPLYLMLDGTPHGTARGLVPELDRLTESVWSYRANDAAARPSPRPAVSAPKGKVSRLRDPRVSGWNAGTRAGAPMRRASASPSESGEALARGRSSRSSPRTGKPSTWRRGTGVLVEFTKGGTGGGHRLSGR